MATTTQAQALLGKWQDRELKDFDERDKLLHQMESAGIFPKEQDQYEMDGGLYPDLRDPSFLPKLLKKREFQESKQKSIKDSLAEGKDKCRSSEDFELSSVQRFVSRVLSPRTPYSSSLFYHGVGVGKTCAAITVCESYLEAYPGRKVYIVAPPNIQEGFRRTIFDMEGLTIGKGSVENSHRGCTGNIYLSLTGMYMERDPKVIEAKVTKLIKSRYEFFGYTSFYNHIRRIMLKLPVQGVSEQERETFKRTALRAEFSNRAIIIDEAHNLRDIVSAAAITSASASGAEEEEDAKDDISPQDTEDSKGGKKLTPYLQEVLRVSEGITLILMTATPMYNSYVEIVFLLNLLLLNDKFQKLNPEEIFDLKSEKFNDAMSGRQMLGRIASNYVSFMRGENPLTFPLRLEPQSEMRVNTWPIKTPKGSPIHPNERKRVALLPCVGAVFSEETEALYKKKATEIVSSAEGLGITNMDLLIQAGNWIFPGEEGDDILDRIRQTGFDNTFVKEKRGMSTQFRCRDDLDASWLLEENLPAASGKCATVLKRVNNAKGVVFVYSRFVASGALAIAFALEANGYTPATGLPLLLDGNQGVEGRQCALCNRKEKGHGIVQAEEGPAKTQKHSFKPAKYVLLTGSMEISPDNAASINAARSPKNTMGEEVKVVIGSQIAGEGLDLRYVREVLVFDSWYHLNKLEQIIGRGIRNCSHAALDETMRNCTVTLLVNSYASSPEMESIDMYSYRTALRKAITVGNVTRVLKEYALDCSLNRDAIVVEGLDPVPVLYDSQGVKREGVNRNDTPLTSMCDWLDKCQYDCLYESHAKAKYSETKQMPMKVSLETQDSSTYDEYTARYQLNTLRKYIQELFGEKDQGVITFDMIRDHFGTIPEPLLKTLMAEMVQQKEMKIRLQRDDHMETGRILYKNGFYVFQPDKIKDTSIPIAIRVASIPMQRDHYEPKAIEKEKEEDVVASIIGEDVSKKIASGDEDSEELWEEVLEWVEEIRSGAEVDGVPIGIRTQVSNLKESAGIMKGQEERLEMIVWLYNHIRGNEEMRKVFADCVLDYFWDEFITHGTRRELLNSVTNPIIKNVARDMFWTMEGKTYVRFVNYTNEIEYLCVKDDGNTMECSRAVAEVLSKEVGEDPILKRPLNTASTGYEYGFILYNPKKMRFVFKKGQPPQASPASAGGEKPKIGRGAECIISSATQKEAILLTRLGETLRQAGKGDFGLVPDPPQSQRIKNAHRICTVCNLVLRYMDRAKIQGKRWFYRPLEAKMYGHPLR